MTYTPPSAPLVPPLYCPLLSAIHLDSAAVARRSIDWLASLGLFEQQGLREQMVRTRAAEWASRIAPFAERHRLQIISDWTHLGFAIDDCRFDAGPLVDRPGELIPLVMRLMLNLEHLEAPAGDDPFSRGSRDLSARARGCAPATVVRRWVEGNTECFFAVACLTAYRVAGTMPSLAAYVDLGPRDRAMKLTGSQIELAEGTSLPHDERESPPVRAVTRAANLLVTIGNDLFSFAKEAEYDVLESNIVAVIGHEDGCEPQLAIRKAVALHDRLMCRYLVLRRRIESSAGKALRHHLSQLDHLI